MRSFRSKLKINDDLSVEIPQDMTWDQVLETMGTLLQRHKHGHSFGQRFFDRLGDSSDAFKAWLETLPAGDYSSMMCVAFKLVIKA